MKTLSRNFFKKSIAVLLAFAFVATSMAVSSVEAYAAETAVVENQAEEISADATTRSRLIISSDSVVDYRNSYRSANFTTARLNTRIHHGMSYYIDCSTPNARFNMQIFKSNGQLVTSYGLASNNPMASATFYLDANTTYYIVVTPTVSNAVYDFAYNIYYDN